MFEDPLSKCEGYEEYAAQWFALVSSPTAFFFFLS